ncbi:hypothetical protein BD769DRAFT_1664414 [Suillus cothurnatus]|nr:hypothetical protein BD769DRAFT_1664414 [Suillus cothurnatus]
MQTNNSKTNLSAVSDIITALQTILCSRAIPEILDLETPYSRTVCPNPNHCAIELKDQSISAIITERQYQLDTVLHDISGLQTVMDGIHTLQQQLIERKNKIIESINLHRRLVSPLWRLPTEVLSQIFCHCLPQIPELNELQSPSKLTLLTSICRRWREVAVGISNLWCILSVKVDDRDWQQAALVYDFLLKRARGRPLSLTLQFYEHNNSTELRRLLRPYINEFYHPDIPDPDTFRDFLALEEMFVYIDEKISDGGVMPHSISRSISQLPFSLCSFDISGLLLDFDDLSSFNPVWTHLTTLNIDVWGARAALHLLQLAPNLSTLTIHVEFEGFSALRPFTHTNLQILDIRCEGFIVPDGQFCNLLDALSLPSLRVLAYEGVEWPHEEFKAFLARSECPLESLITSEGDVTDEQ